ncbi:hypothetical protein ABXW19_12070, partial [Streptococcus suis]|uniref:hypothetical protein n=1 Tax=Streptococcus suis TaxID=1307 RepID=UPI003CEAE51D
NREFGASRLQNPIPRALLLPGAFSDDAGSEDELHGLSKDEWRKQRRERLNEDQGYEAVTPSWRNPHLTKAYKL